MATSEERREVAERLRSAAKTESGDSDYLWNRLEIAVNGWRFGDVIDDSYVFYNDVLARLADLIDPQERTCHIIKDFKPSSMTRATSTDRCSECGHVFGRSSRDEMIGISYQDYDAPYYCPHCGARVVYE